MTPKSDTVEFILDAAVIAQANYIRTWMRTQAQVRKVLDDRNYQFWQHECRQ